MALELRFSAAQIRALNEQHEEMGRDIPIVAEYLELRDDVFLLADELGIGEQVRTLYHDTAAGAKAGAIAGVGVADLAGGGALAATYSGAAGLGAALGMATGAVGGAVLAAISIFGWGDDEDAQKKAAASADKAAAAYSADMLRHWTLADMSAHARADSRELAFSAHLAQSFGGADPAALSRSSQVSAAMAELYDRIAQRASPVARRLFEVTSNVARLAAWRGQVIAAGALSKKIDALISAERASLKDLARGLNSRGGGWLASQDLTAGTLARDAGVAALLYGALYGAWRLYRRARA